MPMPMNKINHKHALIYREDNYPDVRNKKKIVTYGVPPGISWAKCGNFLTKASATPPYWALDEYLKRNTIFQEIIYATTCTETSVKVQVHISITSIIP